MLPVSPSISGTFSETKRQAGLLRMLQAGVIVSDHATLVQRLAEDLAKASYRDCRFLPPPQ
jgi:hypothetical protein